MGYESKPEEEILFPRDHNKPPFSVQYSELNDDLQTYLDTHLTDIENRTQELVDNAANAPAIVTADNAGKVSDVIAQITAHVKAAEAKRTELVAPVLKAQRQVNTWFALHVTEKLDTPKMTTGVKQQLLHRLTIYERKVADEERKRREAEEDRAREEARAAAAAAAELEKALRDAKSLDDAIAAQEAAKEAQAKADEAAKAASAKAADMATVRGTYGSSSSLRTTWTATIEDVTKIDVNALRDFLGTDAIQKALNAYVKLHKDTRPLAGVRFHEVTSAVVRG